MKKTLLVVGLAAAMMPFAFAQQAPATNSGTNATQTQGTKKPKKAKKTKNTSNSGTSNTAPSK
jgi:opacity protein-like surface antigen